MAAGKAMSRLVSSRAPKPTRAIRPNAPRLPKSAASASGEKNGKWKAGAAWSAAVAVPWPSVP